MFEELGPSRRSRPCGPLGERRTGRLVAFGILLGGVIVLPFMLRSVTDAFLFHPTRGQAATPADVGLAYEEVWLQADDGVRTQAWWMPRDGATTCVLSFHGNAGTMADRLGHLKPLHALGVSVLAAEYRGYGDSEGRPSEEGLARDARVALAEARRRCDRVVVHGRSLGGAVAIRLASEEPVDGLIVESTFTTLKEMAASSGIPLATHLVAYEFRSVERIAEVTAPTLVVHGVRDELIPLAMGEALVEAAAGPTTWLAVPGGTHNDTWVVGGERYWAAVREFLAGV